MKRRTKVAEPAPPITLPEEAVVSSAAERPMAATESTLSRKPTSQPRQADEPAVLGALRAVTSLIAVLSGPEHVYEFANEAWMRATGRRDLVGRRFEVARTDPIRGDVRPALDLVYRTGEPFLATDMQFRVAGADGKVDDDFGFFDVRFEPIRGDGDGRTTGILVEAVDVTTRRRAEEERASLKAQFLQVQKLESLGVLAGGIAHDFNNLLTGMLGSASAALLVVPEGSLARRAMENVVLAARRASDLTRQLLAYSGKGHFEIRAVDLSAHMREIASLLETTIPKKVHLELYLTTDLPPIQADVAQLQQVTMNLVVNGAEAIGDRSGTVSVTTRTEDVTRGEGTAGAPPAILSPGEVAPGRYVVLEVKDTGCGMDEATQRRIFDPFFTTKVTGRGLGLAAVLGIVRSHEGAIAIESHPGAGTTFRVYFPASAITQRMTAAAPKAFEPLYEGTGLVLVVDDDEGVRRAARMLFELFGFEVVVAVDGRHGVEVFRERRDELTLVMLDMTMPEMGGEETFREIHRLAPQVPVLLTSGYSEAEAKERFTEPGLAGFLQKPFTPAELSASLAAVLPPSSRKPSSRTADGRSAP